MYVYAVRDLTKSLTVRLIRKDPKMVSYHKSKKREYEKVIQSQLDTIKLREQAHKRFQQAVEDGDGVGRNSKPYKPDWRQTRRLVSGNDVAILPSANPSVFWMTSVLCVTMLGLFFLVYRFLRSRRSTPA